MSAANRWLDKLLQTVALAPKGLLRYTSVKREDISYLI